MVHLFSKQNSEGDGEEEKKMSSSLFSSHYKGKKRWEIIKKDPELHKKHKESCRKYFRKHKEKLNNYHKNYANEMRKIAIELGNCSTCFKEKDNPKYKTCSKCRIKYRKYNNNFRRRKENDL